MTPNDANDVLLSARSLASAPTRSRLPGPARATRTAPRAARTRADRACPNARPGSRPPIRAPPADSGPRRRARPPPFPARPRRRSQTVADGIVTTSYREATGSAPGPGLRRFERQNVEGPVGNDEEAFHTGRKRGQRVLQEDVVKGSGPGCLPPRAALDESDEEGSLLLELFPVRLQPEETDRFPRDREGPGRRR